MRRWIVIAALAAVAVAGASRMVGAIAGPGADVAGGPDAASGSDAGTNERLLIVVGGEYDTRAAAEEANARLSFGDLQGFYVAPSGAFEGMKPGRWLLVSAFRTRAGAADFEEFARTAGAPALREVLTRYRGTQFIGLGQEAHPDGRGALHGPLPEDDPNAL